MMRNLRIRLAQGCLGLGIATVSGVAAFHPGTAQQFGLTRLGGLRQGAQCQALATGCIASVPLASSIKTRQFPTTVLVHGLDSSKETWTGLLSDLNSKGYPALALDLRGSKFLCVISFLRMQ